MYFKSRSIQLDPLEPRRLLATNLLADVSGIYPTDSVLAGGFHYFYADDGVHGRELWKSDGTVEGTAMVSDVVPGDGSPNVTKLLAAGDRVLFFIDTTQDGPRSLWTSDGTSGGTFKLMDAGIDAQDLVPAVTFNDRVYFAVSTGEDQSHSSTLWSTDGTLAGTEQFYDLPFIDMDRRIAYMFVTGDRITFMSHQEMWGTDGTTAGTFKLSRDSAIIDFVQPELVNDKLYFRIGPILWSTNGTVAGTDPVPGTPYGVSHDMTSVGDQLYFLQHHNGTFLWCLDTSTGEATKLVELKDVDFRRMEAVGGTNRVIFSGGTAETGQELWVTDGTSPGTRLLREFKPGADGGLGFGMTSAGAFVFFEADDQVHGMELWRTDGTVGGTQLVQDSTPGPASSNVRLSTVDGKVVMQFLSPGSRTTVLDPATMSSPVGPLASRMTVADRVLRVFGTRGADSIRIYQIAGNPDRFAVNLNGVKRSFAFADVRKVMVFGYSGNDNIAFSYVNGAFVLRSMILAGAGDDRVYGGATRDSIWGEEGDDYIHASSSHDELFGGIGDDVLIGMGGDDTLDGESGADTVMGGDGRDMLAGGYDEGLDRLDGGGGIDVIFGTAVFEIFFGGEEGGDPLDEVLLA